MRKTMRTWMRMCRWDATPEPYWKLTMSRFVVEKILGHAVDKDVHLLRVPIVPSDRMRS